LKILRFRLGLCLRISLRHSFIGLIRHYPIAASDRGFSIRPSPLQPVRPSHRAVPAGPVLKWHYATQRRKAPSLFHLSQSTTFISEWRGHPIRHWREPLGRSDLRFLQKQQCRRCGTAPLYCPRSGSRLPSYRRWGLRCESNRP